MISGVMVGTATFDDDKSNSATLQASSATKSDVNGATLDDAIETVSDDELPSDHEDGEISEDLSDIFRSSVELTFSFEPHFCREGMDCLQSNFRG